MKPLRQFVSDGARDADARLAAALAPQPLDRADRYLKASRIVAAIDRLTVMLEQSWLGSMTGQSVSELARSFAAESRRDQRSAIASVVLTAVVVHIVLTMANGPRPGWFWIVIPALAALFAALVLVAARGSQSNQ